MNRILINSAAAINIAAAALIYIACSGDDGKDGASCTGVPTASGVDIVCDGVKQGSVSNGSGAAGTCTVLPPDATGAFSAQCGGQTYPLGGGAAGGGCSISDGDAYYILTCGSTPMQIAKAWCGDKAYNPSKQVCDTQTGEVSDQKCGLSTINLDYEFCVSGKKYFLCGIRSTQLNNSTGIYDTVITKGVAYDPATQFCYTNTYFIKGSTNLPAGSAADTVYYRCGAVEVPLPAAGSDAFNDVGVDTTHSNFYPRGIGWFDAKRQFCYAGAAGSEVTKLCGSLTAPDLYGDKFTIGQVCDGNLVKATCGNNPPVNYEVSEYFCQGAGANAAVKPLCGPDELTYTADQFCQVNSGTGEAMTYSASSATDAKVETRCATGATPKAPFLPTEFCQQQPGANANSIVKPLCGTANETAEKYTSTQFCQVKTVPAAGTVEITSGGIDPDAVIKDKCGSGRVFPSTSYCPTGGTTEATSPKCVAAGRAAGPATGADVPFDPETEFCVGGVVYPTCEARRSDRDPTNTNNASLLPYKPSEVVCEPRSNTKLDFVTFKSGIAPVSTVTGAVGITTANAAKTWLVKNVTLNNASTFTWNEAKTACPQKPTGVWRLPTDVDWEGLAKASDPTSGFEGANAGINLRTTTGWGLYPSLDAVYSKFAATPAAVTGITPAPAANSAYWWTAGQGGWITVTNPTTGVTTTAPGTNYDLGNYVYTTELNPTLVQGGASKLTTKLSVRCVSNDASQNVNSGGGGNSCGTGSNKQYCDQTNCVNVGSGSWVKIGNCIDTSDNSSACSGGTNPNCRDDQCTVTGDVTFTQVGTNGVCE